jgi:hypothetical protein
MVVEGALTRSWRRGQTGVPGFLEDHAAVAMGLFALFAATGEPEWYLAAERLTIEIPRRFADAEGGYFDTPSDAESLIKRPKGQADNPLPSGNSLAAESLLTLSSYTGDTGLRDQAGDALRAAGLLMDKYPSMVGHHLSVLHSFLDSRELAVVGPHWRDMAAVYWERFRPSVVIASSESGNAPIPLLAGRATTGETFAYLCRGQVCDLPTSDPDVLRDQLS